MRVLDKMKLITNYIIGAVLVVISLTACDTDTIEPDTSRVGFDYFPLETGLFRVYDVEDITFSVLGNDTARFQLKEQVVDSFQNQNGDFTFVLHRFSRIDDSNPWGLDSVWTARKTPWQAITIENNVPFIKLSFPIKLDSVWDGNALNIGERDEYFINELFGTTTINDTDVNTIKVVQEEQEDIISRNIRNETYGENIGLISKTKVAIDFCNDTDCFGQQIIERGKSVKLTIIEFGKE